MSVYEKRSYLFFCWQFNKAGNHVGNAVVKVFFKNLKYNSKIDAGYWSHTKQVWSKFGTLNNMDPASDPIFVWKPERGMCGVCGCQGRRARARSPFSTNLRGQLRRLLLGPGLYISLKRVNVLPSWADPGSFFPSAYMLLGEPEQDHLFWPTWEPVDCPTRLTLVIWICQTRMTSHQCTSQLRRTGTSEKSWKICNRK